MIPNSNSTDYNICTSEKCQQIIVVSSRVFTGLSTLPAVIVSGKLVFNHAINYSMPYFQDKIIVIVNLVPFYAILSFLSTLFARSSSAIEIFALVRCLYEGVLVYTFYRLMISYVCADENLQRDNLEKLYQSLVEKGEVRNVWPLHNFCVARIQK